jgi:hypothetical protein
MILIERLLTWPQKELVQDAQLFITYKAPCTIHIIAVTQYCLENGPNLHIVLYVVIFFIG